MFHQRKMSNVLKLICVIILFVGSESAKILGVFPLPLPSHHIVFRPLMSELAKRGHEVTVITSDPEFPLGQAPPNLTEIDLHDITYDYWNSNFAPIAAAKNQIDFFKAVIDLILRLAVVQLKTAEIQKLLHENENFDLVITETCARPALVYSHIYKAPAIEFSTLSGVFSILESQGAATHPLIYINPIQRKINNLTIWEKLQLLYNYFRTEAIYANHLYTENDMLNTIIDSKIDYDLRRNVQMVFLNVYPVWDFNRPVPPNVIHLGGLHLTRSSELQKDWKTYLDSSKNGVIYISFGTNVKPSMLPLEKIKIFNNVFSRLPYDVVWKWDKEELPGRPQNVRISKWLPQPAILRHPKVKLFITQGGLQSTDEAIAAGVPLIGVPIMSDQFFNVEQYLRFNIGKRLQLETLTEEELSVCIDSVINDESYRQNIVKLRNIMTDQPQSSLERAVWWTEHVLRHGGGAHLRAPAAHMSWTDYYEIELVLVLLAAFVLLLTVTVLAIHFIVSRIKNNLRFKTKLD